MIIEDDYGFVGERGRDGVDGQGLLLVGEWKIGRQYNVGEIVSYKGSSFMAVVVNAGRIPGVGRGREIWQLLAARGEQGPAGVGQRGRAGVDGIDGVGGGSTTQASAEFDSPTVAGQPIYIAANGHANLAQSNAVGTSQVSGLAVANVSAGVSGSYETDGNLTLEDWTAVTGSVSLSPGATYYLSPDSPGQLTKVAPTATGHVVAVIGKALTTETLSIEIAQAIAL